MVRIKKIIFHISNDELTDKERKINIVLHIICVVFFYLFISFIMTFRGNFNYFALVFLVGVLVWVPEFVFKIFLKDIDNYFNLYSEEKPDRFSLEGYALEHIIRAIGVSSTFFMFFTALKAELPGFCGCISILYPSWFFFIRRKKYWKNMFEMKEEYNPREIRLFVNRSTYWGAWGGIGSIGIGFYDLYYSIVGWSSVPIIYSIIFTILSFVLISLTLCVDLWDKKLPWDLSNFKYYDWYFLICLFVIIVMYGYFIGHALFVILEYI